MNLYSNPKAVSLLKQLTAIALKAQGHNPSPVDIKQQLAELDYHLLKEINENLATALKPDDTKPAKPNNEYWLCKCLKNNVHSIHHIDFCPNCNTNVEDGQPATDDDIKELIADHLSK